MTYKDQVNALIAEIISAHFNERTYWQGVLVQYIMEHKKDNNV
jgi:hypothetical protein